VTPLAVLLAATSLAAPIAPVDPSAERCELAARRLKETARALDNVKAPVELERAHELTSNALLLAQGAEVRDRQPPLLLPWLKTFQTDSAKDADQRALAERLHFASERLRGSCATLDLTALAPPGADHARLLSILSRPEFELHSRDEQLLARLLQRIWTWLRDVVAQNETVQEASLSARTVFLVAACLSTAWLAFRLSRIRIARRRRQAALNAGEIVLDDPGRYQEQAGSALTHGDGREAIRLGLLALLATLERSRLAAPGRTATNREVADHVSLRGGPPALSEKVRELVGWYDRAWYGLSRVEAEEAQRFCAASWELCAVAAQVRAREVA
jgi:hypothetical protein